MRQFPGLMLVLILVFPDLSLGWVAMRDNEGRALRWDRTSLTIYSRIVRSSALETLRFEIATISAMGEWNLQGSPFEFRLEEATSNLQPSCASPDHRNAIGFAQSNCGGAWSPGTLAVTQTWSSGGTIIDTDIIFNDYHHEWGIFPGPKGFFETLLGYQDYHRVLLHELGHVMGLDHPNDYGQKVRAIMNSHASYLSSLQDDDVAGIRGLYGVSGPVPRDSLENPSNLQIKSGIGVISGWVCDATNIFVVLNGSPLRVEYGTPRVDTMSVCGDSDNGFVTLINFGNLGAGTHTAYLWVDGRTIGSQVQFKVVTLGAAYIRGLSGAWSIQDFPSAGEVTAIKWDQAIQNVTIFDVE